MRTLAHVGIAAVGLTALLALPTIATTSSPAVGTNAIVAGAPDVGALVDYKFNSAPMNSAGLTSLADLRGRPVLIDFWGTR